MKHGRSKVPELDQVSHLSFAQTLDSQPIPVGAESERPANLAFGLKSFPGLSGGEVPETDARNSPVEGGQRPAVRTDSHRRHTGCTDVELPAYCSCRQVPELDHAIRAAGCQRVSVGSEGEAGRQSHVSRKVKARLGVSGF